MRQLGKLQIGEALISQYQKRLAIDRVVFPCMMTMLVRDEKSEVFDLHLSASGRGVSVMKWNTFQMEKKGRYLRLTLGGWPAVVFSVGFTIVVLLTALQHIFR